MPPDVPVPLADGIDQGGRNDIRTRGHTLGDLIRNCPPHRRTSRVTRRRVRRGIASARGSRSDSHASVGPREAWEHIASCGAPTTDLLMRLCGVPPAHLSNFYETAECSAKERRAAKDPQPSAARRRPAQPQAAHQSSNLGLAVKGATPLLCQPRASQPTRMDKTAWDVKSSVLTIHAFRRGGPPSAPRFCIIEQKLG